MARRLRERLARRLPVRTEARVVLAAFEPHAARVSRADLDRDPFERWSLPGLEPARELDAVAASNRVA